VLEDGKISNRQFKWLIITSIAASSLLFLPSATIEEAKQDAWVSIILVTLFGMASGYILIKLGERFPNQTFVSYSQLIVGKFLGKSITLIYILFFIHINANIIREFSETLTSIFLKNTPILLIIISMVIVAASAVRNGIEVISRVNEIIFPSIIIFLFIIFSFIIPELDPANLKPVLANGITPVLKGSYPALLFFAETIILIVIFPTINQPKKSLSSVFKAILFLGIVGIIAIIEIIALFGSIESGNLHLPMLSLIRYIELFDFIERIDVLIMASWFGGGFIKITVFYYCLSISTAEFFDLKSYKPVVLPLGVILTTFSIILYQNINEMSKIIFNVLPPYYIFIEVGIPLFLLLIALLRGIDARNTS
jgi:spore germination protein KB